MKVEQDESELPKAEDWATTSSGSTHTSDYTWTKRTDERSSGEDSVSLGGSAYSAAKYTEEGDESVTGSGLRRNIPALHAMKTSESDEELAVEGKQQKKAKKVRAYLLKEETLEELKFGDRLTKDQLARVK